MRSSPLKSLAMQLSLSDVVGRGPKFHPVAGFQPLPVENTACHCPPDVVQQARSERESPSRRPVMQSPAAAGPPPHTARVQPVPVDNPMIQLPLPLALQAISVRASLLKLPVQHGPPSGPFQYGVAFH